ncbi:unnamed protein product, partial [Notodromas monacha]
QRKIIGDAPLKERILEELGGFPVTNRTWTPPPFSIERLIGVLKKDYNEGMLMEQWVGPDDKNSSLNIIHSSSELARFWPSEILLARKIIGDAPLKERILEELGGFPVTNRTWTPPPFSIERLIGVLKKDYNEGMLMEQWVGPDDKNSSLNIIQLDQMKLGLPSREYYLGKGNAKYLEAYRQFMTDVAVLLGAEEDYAQQEMKLVLDLETLLANLDQMKLGLPSREYYLGKGNAKYLEAYRQFMTDVAVLLGAEEDYAQQEMKLVLDLETLLANVSLSVLSPAHYCHSR